MRAHCFLHVPFEGPGSIEPWLVENGYTLTQTRFYDTLGPSSLPASRELPEPPPLPDPAGIELLVIMGGPMSVNDEEEFPWLVAEKAFVRDAIESGTPVLGICLGAQMIASAMGAEVFPNTHKEIGWFPVHSAPAPHTAENMVFSFPSETTVFHWHGETFQLPAGAVLLASSPVCKNQAFQLGKRVIGLQFHLETTPDSARAIVQNCRDELQPAEYVQTEDGILSAPAEQYQSINGLMSELLAFLLRQS